MRMDEEMRMLQLDKPGQGKSYTELQKHSLDEALFEHKPVERAIYIVSKGDELQKLSVIGSLPELLKYDQKGTVSKIIPKIQQELPNSSSEFNLAVSRMFNVLMHMDIPVNLVPQVLQGIENKDPIIANAWMETLLAVIPLLKEPAIKNDIIKCAISKSQLSRATYFRVSSCKILGKISVHKSMSPFEVKKDVLPLVQSLCQDCFYEVRAAMCKELPNVAQGLFNLGDAIVKVNLLPLLVELSADENVFVRSVAIESVVSIMPYLSSDTIKGTIIPLTKKLCTRSASEGDTTYTAIARVFSMLIVNLQPQMSPGDAMWFLDYYSYICKKGLSLVEDLDTDPSICMLCRENCAYCLPTVATMVLAQIPTEISGKWYHTFKALAADPCYIVRKSVATCFSNVVKILGGFKNTVPLSCRDNRILGISNKIVVNDFTKLLRDEDEEVLQALTPNIGRILEQFTSTNVLQREVPVQATLDIGRAMLKCQIEAFRTNNWRMKECLLTQWERLPNCFPSDFIHQHFSPVVLSAAVYGKAKPVRSQATKTFLIILKYSLKENHRKWIREMILTQLCYSPCCYSRQMYITLCNHAINIFSWRYFKEYFYLPLLSLSDDRIPVVRLCLVKLCPILKQMLILPADKALQLKLESVISHMEVKETDKDVMMTLRMKLNEMRTLRTIRNEILVEDKRRVDEEDKVLKGKWIGSKITPQYLGITVGQKDSDSSKETPEKPVPIVALKPGITKPSIPIKRLADGTASSMPFLDQHFYIDAGVSLPQDFGNASHRDRDLKSPLKTSLEVTKLIESAENLTSWLDEISMSDDPVRFYEDLDSRTIQLEEKDMVISIENVNPAETLTVNDVKALETTTTNMTDELKANIQSVSEANTNKFKPRPKRFSCVFNNEIRSAATSSDTSLRRRSLNIPNSESKIPISSRGKRLSYHEKSKSVSDQALDVSSNKSQRLRKFSRFTKSALNLRDNNTKEQSIAFSTDNFEVFPKVDKLEFDDEDVSRIPSINSTKCKQFTNDKIASKDYITDNIRFSRSSNLYRTSSSSKVLESTHIAESTIETNQPFAFKRYSASDKTFKEILSDSKNNNSFRSKEDTFSQGNIYNSSNDTSTKLVENRGKNSGLPLSLRKKGVPK